MLSVFDHRFINKILKLLNIEDLRFWQQRLNGWAKAADTGIQGQKGQIGWFCAKNEPFKKWINKFFFRQLVEKGHIYC